VLSIGLALFVALFWGPAEGHAQVGDGAWASPALGRVLVASERAPGVGLAGLAGWAFTEDVLGEGDSHHRASGSLAIAGRPLRWLTIGLRADGRWDHHLVGGNDDESAVGEPRLLVRGDVSLGAGVSLGLAAIVLVPGAGAPSLAFEATTLDLRALFSFLPEGSPIGLALDVGYRFDGTARAVTRPVPFGRADLVSLGTSDSDALLLGAGVRVPIDDTELFGEVSSDLLVLSGLAASPVRVLAGVRAPLVPNLLSLLGQVEVGMGGRLPVDRAGALVPIEPRVALTVGLVLSPSFGSDPQADAAADDEGLEDGGDASVSALSGRILDPSGSPIAGAVVRIEGGDSTTTSADGAFTLTNVPANAELIVEAEGYVAQRIAAGAIREGEATSTAITLSRDLPSGALRGLVRSRRGRALSATITVEPGALSATTDADGVFEIELPPGRYEVTIEAEGHERQERTVEVEVDGVTVINADLRGR
jgi:hypothetical protein